MHCKLATEFTCNMFKYSPSSFYNERVGCSSGEIIDRSFKIYTCDPHPKKKTIILRGELTIRICTEDGSDVLGEETRDFKKLIRLDGLRDSSSAEQIVADIYDKCPFIDHRLGEYLCSVVEILKSRSYDDQGLALPNEDGSDDDLSEDFADGFDDNNGGDYEEDQEGADMTGLEAYVELLYEELGDKVKGARMIAKLAKMPENLVAIADHETALNALFRTLREDYKKSLDLTTNILQTCFYFAQFEDFHDLLITNKICSITFDIVEHEMTRNEKWKEEVLRRQNQAQDPNASAKVKHNFERISGKYTEISRKQDLLLRVAFDTLFRLYEHPELNAEILQRGIVGYLMEALERRNVDLLLLVVDFLKALSILLTCKNAMGQLQIVDKVMQLTDREAFPNDLVSLSLRLLYNLSFDTKMRHRMVKLELLPKLGALAAEAELEPICLNILYVMSMDKRLRPRLAQTDVVTTVIKVLTEPDRDPELAIEPRALAINLAKNKRASLNMCANNGVANLLGKAFENEDALMMKIIRNIAEHEGATKELFIEYIGDLASAITKVAARDFALECVGTLGHLTIPDMDYAKLLKEFGLVPWIKSVLQNGKNSSASKREGKQSALDVLCTVIYFLGTCAGDGECAEYLISQGVLDLLLKNFASRGDRAVDSEIKCHILFFCYKLSSHKKTRAYLVEQSRVPQLLLDLLHDGNKQVRDISGASLELIGGYSDIWESRVRKERFVTHNEAWLDVIEKITNDPMLQADLQLATSLGPAGSKRGELVPTSSADTSDTIESASESETSEEESEEVEGHRTRQAFSSGVKGGGGGGDDEEEDNPDYEDQQEANGESGNFFDQFKHQYQDEMERKERWEYGITDDEDEDEVQVHRDLAAINAKLVPYPHQSVAYRIASASSAHRRGQSGRAQAAFDAGDQMPKATRYAVDAQHQPVIGRPKTSMPRAPQQRVAPLGTAPLEGSRGGSTSEVGGRRRPSTSRVRE